MKLNDANPTDTKLYKQLENMKYRAKKLALNTEPKERKCRKDSKSGYRNISIILIDTDNVDKPIAKECKASIGETVYLATASFTSSCSGYWKPFKSLDSAISYRNEIEKTQ